MARNDDRGRECPASAAQRQAPSARSASRGWGPRTGRPAAGGHGPQGNPVQFPDPTPFPHRFPVNSHALPSVEGLVGQDEIDAAIHTMSTSNARRVDFGGCGPPYCQVPGGHDGAHDRRARQHGQRPARGSLPRARRPDRRARGRDRLRTLISHGITSKLSGAISADDRCRSSRSGTSTSMRRWASVSRASAPARSRVRTRPPATTCRPST
jgi:hypothetical protein